MTEVSNIRIANRKTIIFFAKLFYIIKFILGIDTVTAYYIPSVSQPYTENELNKIIIFLKTHVKDVL